MYTQKTFQEVLHFRGESPLMLGVHVCYVLLGYCNRSGFIWGGGLNLETP